MGFLFVLFLFCSSELIGKIEQIGRHAAAPGGMEGPCRHCSAASWPWSMHLLMCFVCREPCGSNPSKAPIRVYETKKANCRWILRNRPTSRVCCTTPSAIRVCFCFVLCLLSVVCIRSLLTHGFRGRRRRRARRRRRLNAVCSTVNFVGF